MTSRYFAGLDLGQAQDFTALAIVEVQGVGADRKCFIRHLQRWPLGTAYPTICAEVATKLKNEPLCSAPLVVDATGVGRPVVDIFKSSIAAHRLYPVTITGGDTENNEGNYWRVPKRILVSTVQVLLQSGRLKIAPALPEAQTLVRELQTFQVKISDNAHDSYGAWREGAHDDLVLAVALACWAANQRNLLPTPSALVLGSASGWGYESERPGPDGVVATWIDGVLQ